MYTPQVIADNPILVWVIALIILFLIIAYWYSNGEVEKERIDKYDIRCTIPGQLQIVFQDIPEGNFNFDYDGIVYVERDWKSHYLPLQYTTILPNE